MHFNFILLNLGLYRYFRRYSNFATISSFVHVNWNCGIVRRQRCQGMAPFCENSFWFVLILTSTEQPSQQLIPKPHNHTNSVLILTKSVLILTKSVPIWPILFWHAGFDDHNCFDGIWKGRLNHTIHKQS